MSVSDSDSWSPDWQHLLPHAHARTLLSLIDTIVPADEYPSASEAGGLEFLHGVLTGDHPDWLPRLKRVLARLAEEADDFADRSVADRIEVLDRMAGDSEYQWFSLLVHNGYWADPDNGGNRDGASWKMIGWSRQPVDGWRGLEPETNEQRRAFIRPGELRDHYDAIVIGSGAGGGVAACALAESGRRVLVVERGDWPSTQFLAADHLRNARTDVGFDHRTAPTTGDNPRTLDVEGDEVTIIQPTDYAWGNNAMTGGGGTRIYGGHAWRFTPEDFRMATTYGVPDGSALADWPVSYDEMEPYYCRAEWELGVSGTAEGDVSAGFRSRDYPMPPLESTLPAEVLKRGAERLGISTFPPPLLINSRPYHGREACSRISQCVGFACLDGAKNGSFNTVIPRAIATGNCDILLATRAERIVTDSGGRVTGVALVGDIGGSVWRRKVTAGEVVVSAGAMESARLLLNSRTDREPNGLGNNADQVGRHLQGHLYGGSLGIFEEPIADLVGPGPAIATCDFRHYNHGIVGGGMLTNGFVPTPVGLHLFLRRAGLLPLHGVAVKRGMRDYVPRMQQIIGPVHEVTRADSRVRLDPTVRDRFGIPVLRLSGGLHPEDHRTQSFITDRAAEWLAASGAVSTTRWAQRNAATGPSAGQHQAGTARMGSDASNSVTDKWGRVWGHDNLRVVDASLNVTNGGVNPVLTIFANAFRVMDHMVGRTGVSR